MNPGLANPMLRWQRFLPWLAAVSAGLTIASASGVLPAWLAFVFKPLTTLMVIAHAWPRGAGSARQRQRVRIGLRLSLLGDVFLLWPQQGFLPGLVSFLLAHLAYIAAFSVPLRFGARPWVFAVYGAIAALILAQLWPGIPPALRLPVLAYVVCLACMAAQASAWWRASAGTPTENLARSAAFGGVLFMASDSLLAFNKFAAPLPLSALWILLTYWLAQWCIANSLAAATRSD
jgi:uncharacterized membrane protein YhhN